MQFSFLEEIPDEWQRVLVIGRNITRGDERYHIIGMTSGASVRLYILEPFREPENPLSGKRDSRPQRKRLKQQRVPGICYLHCSEFYLGNTRLKIQGGTGTPLKYSEQDYRTIHLFLDMMDAGWTVPDWLKYEDWDNLQLTTLTVADRKRLPGYVPGMPITIKHRPDPVQHFIEKAVTLTVGRSRSFSFTDHLGEEVRCHIDKVSLIDVWENTKKQLRDPRYLRKVPPERLQEMKDHYRKALEQSCPEGMCFIGVEYECSKDYQLQFYSRDYLRSVPEIYSGSSAFFLIHLKPDQEIGPHGLLTKGCVIQKAVAPDTTRVSAELFSYYEKNEAWTEIV